MTATAKIAPQTAFRPSAVSGPFELLSKWRGLVEYARAVRLTHGDRAKKVYRSSLGRTMEFRREFILSREG